jgi:hypothetical protein
MEPKIDNLNERESAWINAQLERARDLVAANEPAKAGQQFTVKELDYAFTAWIRNENRGQTGRSPRNSVAGTRSASINNLKGCRLSQSGDWPYCRSGDRRYGRPLGTEEFVRELEGATKQSLAPRKGGRPRKEVEDERQGELVFEP